MSSYSRYSNAILASIHETDFTEMLVAAHDSSRTSGRVVPSCRKESNVQLNDCAALFLFSGGM